MGVMSMDGTSSSSSYPCQKCGCVCTPKSKETQPKYSRECQNFFDQIVDNSFQSAESVSASSYPGGYHHHQQQQQQQFRPFQQQPQDSNPSFSSDFLHRHHHRATASANLDLHHQVESLKARLKQTSEQVEKLEHSLFDERKAAEQDAKKFQNESKMARDKYERLMESHKQLLRVNQMLEEKVISTAEKAEANKSKLQSVLFSLSSQLKASACHVQALEGANERLRLDCSVAVRLLQCRPSTFLNHRFDDLPTNFQERVKANLTYEEMKRVEESRQAETTGGGGGGGGGVLGLGGLWSFFSLPSSLTVVSTFPPSAAFFNEKNDYSILDSDDKKNSDSVSIDMFDPDADVGAATLPTSVLARVFDSASSSNPVTRSSSADKMNSSVLTPEQENLLKMYDLENPPSSSSSPLIFKPDIFPCSSSSSSSSDANEVNLQYYKCRRCRLQCVTAEKWTQTALAPIYGGNGQLSTSTSTSTTNEDDALAATLPIHLVGWKNNINNNINNNSSSSSLYSTSTMRSSFPVLRESSSLLDFTSAAPPPSPPPLLPSRSRSQIPHANTFPDLGVFPDLVPTGELPAARARMASSSSSSSSQVSTGELPAARARMASSSSSSSSRTVHSQTDENVGLTMLTDENVGLTMLTTDSRGGSNFCSGGSTGTSLAFTSPEAVLSPTFAASSASQLDAFDSGRRRNDSESGSVFGGGWGDIHFGDATNGANASNADFILDLSGGGSGGGGGCPLVGLGNPHRVGNHATSEISTSTALSSCLEEVALND